MFPRPSEVLKAREGSLAETPLPLLLHALFLEERTGTLELKVRALSKRIFFEEGVPVGCSSNLLHETLGKFLVTKGKLEEAQYQKALLETVETGKKMGAVLVSQALLTPFDLYKQLQANLAHKILDCFRWSDATFRLLGDPPELEAPVKMNTGRLILTGTLSALPFDVVCTHLAFADEQRFAVVPKPAHEVAELKLSPKETRLLQLLKAKPVFNELTVKTGLDTEALLRRLYALCVLGLVDFAEAVEALPPAVEAAPVADEAPAAPVVVSAALGYLDEDAATKDALVERFLAHRNRDPFALLGVDAKAQLAQVRRAFLDLCEKFAPNRFVTSELKEKAEALLLAHARAYAILSDPEQLQLWQQRRRVEAERLAASRPSTAEQFRLNTSLLDAKSQFEEGLARLEAGNQRGAFEHFEYACDIEPKPLYRAHLAWARYQLNPGSHGKLALSELEELGRKAPECEHAFVFAAEILRAQGRLTEAELAYRNAYRANPQQRRYADLANELGRTQKKKA